MDDNLVQVIDTIFTQAFTDDLFLKLINIFQNLNGTLLIEFVNKNFDPLFKLEHWIWTKLRIKNDQSFHQSNALEFLKTFALFNKNLIFTPSQDIDVKKKYSLLLPENSTLIEEIFEQIQSLSNEDDLYFFQISLWFDNLAYFLSEYTQFIKSPIFIDINQLIGLKFLLTKQSKYYLIQLQQKSLKFTFKQIFYIKTCLSMLSAYFFSKNQSFPYTADQILQYYCEDYLKILGIHHQNVSSWSKELLTCITHLMNFIMICCWWRGDPQKHVQILLPTQEQAEHYVLLLVDILSYKPFHQHIQSTRSNEETILIEIVLTFLIRLLSIYDLVCFMRTKTNLINIVIPLAENEGYNKINLYSYSLLGELLCEEKLKELKITKRICEYYFYILENGWRNPAQIFQRSHVYFLLRGFTNLAKIDCFQQATANMNKLSLFIEMSDTYPMIYEILWALSFNHDIQEQLRANQTFLMNLSHLKPEIDNPQTRKIVHGILWNLNVNHETNQPINNENDQTNFDIMISYSHTEKILVKKLYDQLIKIGYRVWIDFDQMHGNVMDAMAYAIEHSQIVIICMSEHYRQSNYCRAEAFYAFQRQLKIIPILVQEHYKPTGWLLFLVGQLLYIDFIKNEFSVALEMLYKELSASNLHKHEHVPIDCRDEENNIATNLPLPLPLPGIISPKPADNLLSWNETQLQEWLIEQNFKQMPRLLKDYDGKCLITLNKYLKYGELRQILKLLEDDSMRELNENLSLIELARLETLINQQELQIFPKEKDKRRVLFRSNRCKIM